jgi:hypothetical protein
MFNLNDLLAPEYREQGCSLEKLEEPNDRVLILRYKGKEIARFSQTGVTISTIVNIMTQDVSKN